jgi:hypothetical protein
MGLKLDIFLESKLNLDSILESKPKFKTFNLFFKNQNRIVIHENQKLPNTGKMTNFI